MVSDASRTEPSTRVSAASSGGRPVVASVCLDFLKRDMLHVYRQLVGLREFRPVVLTRKRENAELFPFEAKRIAVLPKARTRFLRRFWYRTLRRAPVQIYAGEVERLLEEVLRFEAEVVHIYFGHVAVELLPFIRACPRPLVVSFHGADAGVGVGEPAYRARMVEVLRRADLVLARSNALLRDLEGLGGPQEWLRLHRTGIPLEGFPFQVRTIPPAEGAWQFLQACRLIEKKGVDTALRAFATVAREHPNARFTIAGDGPLRAALEADARTLGVAERVHFPGFVDQRRLGELMAGAHLFLHPSRTGADGNREGVPNAMLEAMAIGLPVLATRHGGIPEAVSSPACGVLVDENDHAALAEGALALIREPDRYHAVASAARRIIEEEFESATQARRLEACYREAIGRRAERLATR